jgi:hypothetical protein
MQDVPMAGIALICGWGWTVGRRIGAASLVIVTDMEIFGET